MSWRTVVGLLILFLCLGCDRYQKGLDLLNEGRFEEAADFFYQKVNQNPDDPRAHNQLGFAYSKLKMYNLAKEEFQKAIQLKPDYFEAFLNLGTACLKNFEYLPAEQNLVKALELNPDSEPAHVNLAWTYYHMSEFDQAREQVAQATRIAAGKRSYDEVLEAIAKKEAAFKKEGLAPTAAPQPAAGGTAAEEKAPTPLAPGGTPLPGGTEPR